MRTSTGSHTLFSVFTRTVPDVPTNSQIILIYPPVSKPSEPPPGIAYIKQALQQNNVTCGLIDANIEGLYHILHTQYTAESSRERSAVRNVDCNINALKVWATFENSSRYKRSVKELDRYLAMAGRNFNCHLRLKNLSYSTLTPVKIADLYYSFQHPEINPFYDYFERLTDRLTAEAPDVIGISLMFLSQALSAFALIGCLRRREIKSGIILGGGLITSWMRKPDWRPFFQDMVDSCLPNRGEQALLRYFGKNTEGHFGPPDYSDFNTDLYFSPGSIFPYSTSRGCYWNKCRFCPEAAENKTFDPVPRNSFIEDIRFINNHVQPKVIHFLDNAIPPFHLNQLIEHPPEAIWYGYVRFEPVLESLDYCQALYNSGCRMLQLGLESGDQHVLDDMHKGTKLALVSRILRNLKESGIYTYVYVLFGTPYESEGSARRTQKFIKKMCGVIDWINPSIFNLPILSQETEQHDTNLFYPGELSLYIHFHHPKGWQRRQVRRFVQGEFLQDPLIKPIYQRTPPSFTSNHAVFFAAASKR